jgi:hypothetical protein
MNDECPPPGSDRHCQALRPVGERRHSDFRWVLRTRSAGPPRSHVRTTPSGGGSPSIGNSSMWRAPRTIARCLGRRTRTPTTQRWALRPTTCNDSFIPNPCTDRPLINTPRPSAVGLNPFHCWRNETATCTGGDDQRPELKVPHSTVRTYRRRTRIGILLASGVWRLASSYPTRPLRQSPQIPLPL